MKVEMAKIKNITFYYIGDLSLLNKSIVAVIGKRDVDSSVLKVAYDLGRELARNGFCVLNGLALGCDASALSGALSCGGKVIAVLPGGLDDIYPTSCKPLANDILKKGGLLLSQYPLGTRPDKRKFVERDRVQALLANKVISVFCDSEGGTMHTLKYANKDGKQIGCVLDCSGTEVAANKMGASRLKTIDSAISFAKLPEYRQLSLFEA